jgi:deferrochelatase/peroxidase EfeB
MLEFDDIQYILLTRVPALTGRYEFLSFQRPAQGRAWLKAIRGKVPSAKAVAGIVNLENNFNYANMDPHGYAVPLGAHIRRMNPRDTAVNIQRRKMIRRGGTYGPPLPEGAPEDGIDRGIAAFVICASLVRQFEFAQNVWANDPNFHELGNERDPMIGAQDGTYDMTIPKRPIRQKIKGLPAFTTVKGGAYFFLPGIKALHYLAALGG